MSNDKKANSLNEEELGKVSGGGIEHTTLPYQKPPFSSQDNKSSSKETHPGSVGHKG